MRTPVAVRSALLTLLAGALAFGAAGGCGGESLPKDPPGCGDGRVDPGETCDDGNTVETDACTSLCAPPSCGDGFVQPPEACDDRNTSNTDACLSSCAAATCGDGYVQAGVEACDPGPSGGTGGCKADCTANVCGDGFVDVSEGCEDGNTVDGDGCSGTCQIEPAWCCIDKTTCVAEGASQVGNTCLVCTPATSKTAWTPAGAVTCDDGLFCNGSDTCSGGSCSSHAGDPCGGGTPFCVEASRQCVQCTGAAQCDDGNGCTTDACNASGTCQHANNANTCSDGLFCNGADTCSGGSCAIHAGNPCTAGDVCDEAANTCGPIQPPGCVTDADCDDGIFCTTDSCVTGSCRNTRRAGCIEP